MVYRWFYLANCGVQPLGPMSMAKAREYEVAHPLHTPLYTANGLEMLRDAINYTLVQPANARQLERDL